MVNLIIISATVLILIAIILAVSVKSLVKCKANEVIVTKSLFGGTKVKSDSAVLFPGFVSGKVVNITPRSGKFYIDFISDGGSNILPGVEVSYVYQVDLDSLRSGAQYNLYPESLLDDKIKQAITSTSVSYSLDEISVDPGKVTKDVYYRIKEEDKSTNFGLVLTFLEINFSKNYKLIQDKINPSDFEDKVDILTASRAKANEEIDLAKINLEKKKELDKIELEKYKLDKEKSDTMTEIEDARIAKKASQAHSKSLSESKKELADQLELSRIEASNKIEMAKMKKEAEIAESNAAKEAELVKISNNLETESKKLEANRLLDDKKSESEISKIKNNTNIKKQEYESQKDLHEERKMAEKRNLEISVILPAESEVEKNKLLAKSKAEIKKIDTDSSIETSKIKLEYKKYEASEMNQIKKSGEDLEIEIYERMLSIAADHPDVAIRWKELETNLKISTVQSESLAKSKIDKIVIGKEDGSNILASFGVNKE